MIPRLSSPSVCVIDDEKADYEPILNALLKLGIACVHIHGDSASPLPPQPFKGLRIVFTDLYLSASIGKTAAAHTANVFKKVVSSDSAPVLVVIWSKHTDERNGDSGLPPEDQPTAAELFKAAVLESEPSFHQRLIFTEMPKPITDDRGNDSIWVAKLQSDITLKLNEFPACDLLWSWESIVREAGISVTKELTAIAMQSSMAESAPGGERPPLDDKLQLIFRHLVKGQGGADCSEISAPRHLAAVLAQSLVDELEHTVNLSYFSHHGKWLCEHDAPLKNAAPFAPHLNALLLTATATPPVSAFVPGTVYRMKDTAAIETNFGLSWDRLIETFFHNSQKGLTVEQKKSIAIPIVIELSPACDVHQGKRCQAMLVAGLLLPSDYERKIKPSGESIHTLPIFKQRWPVAEQQGQDVILTFCCRYKLTLPAASEPEWLLPLFRLRELPTAALRNWHASQSARIGYVSL